MLGKFSPLTFLCSSSATPSLFVFHQMFIECLVRLQLGHEDFLLRFVRRVPEVEQLLIWIVDAALGATAPKQRCCKRLKKTK